MNSPTTTAPISLKTVLEKNKEESPSSNAELQEIGFKTNKALGNFEFIFSVEGCYLASQVGERFSPLCICGV
jgi:hypothetical protein